jgi:hypothetical protein
MITTHTQGAPKMSTEPMKDQTPASTHYDHQTELYFNQTAPDEVVMHQCSVTVMDSTMHGVGGVWISIHGDVDDPATGVSACFNKGTAEWLLHELGQAVARAGERREYVAFLAGDGLEGTPFVHR